MKGPLQLLDLKNVLVELNDNDTNLCVSAERSFLNTLAGGCHVPFAAYSTINEKTITIDALVGSIDGKKIIRDTISGPEEKYIELGIEIAERILKNGGKEIIDSLR